MSNDPFIYGGARSFRKLVEQADDYASTPWPILILGETGCGKELIARRIHSKSLARSGAFVPVNCGALPPALFESELFGYERGAFSGAVQSSRGLIRSAKQGTLFLDEIGELDACAQVKLLRWLDSGEVRAVGSMRIERVDARLIAATHVDLASAVADGRFRLDLFERLGVLVLRVPPLRERREDIVGIARGFLDGLHASYDAADLAEMEEGAWPGNVRQLRNVCFRAVARGKGKVTKALLRLLLDEEASLTAALTAAGREDILASPLAEVEKRVIIERVRRCQGNKKRAAKELGIAKSTLHEKFRRWEAEDRRASDLGHALLGS
jgi:DNA-binding NtrC family response regulator